MVDLSSLEHLSRADLITRARTAGVERPERMTREELKDEIIRRWETDERRRQRARGLFGTARDLLASVVEAGLHMPDAAALIRGDARIEASLDTHPPVATVTLAEIYAAQGHVKRALSMLEEVIAQEPDHEVALALRERLSETRERPTGGARSESRPPAWPSPADGEEREEEPASEATVSEEPADEEPVSEIEATVSEEPADEAVVSEAVVSEAAVSEAAVSEAAVSEAAVSEAAVSEAAPASEEASSEAAVSKAPVREEPVSEVAASKAPLSETAASERPPSEAPARGETTAIQDAVVLIRTSEERLVVYWELRADSVERLQRELSDGHATLQLLGVVPSWDGGERHQVELPINVLCGAMEVTQFPARAAVRAALGWTSPAGFVPIAVARGIQRPSEDGAAASQVKAQGASSFVANAEQRALAYCAQRMPGL